MSPEKIDTALPTALPTVDEVETLVRKWLKQGERAPRDPSAERLAGVLKDPRGLDFTLGFVDRVMRPEDLRVAAKNLEQLSHAIPSFLPWFLRTAIALGGGLALVFPRIVIPIARRVLRRMVAHLVVDASPRALDKSLRHLRSDGTRLNINLLGEAVLGDREADRRLAGTTELLARDDVDYVSIKVSSVASQLSMWGFDETVTRVVERLTPLYEQAAASGAGSSGAGSKKTAKFINLDMEEYRDLQLTIAVFTRVLDNPKLQYLEAGIVLQAYLPDATAALQALTSWAQNRRANGGAGIKVRVVKGANLAMEHVDAGLHDWPLATWPSKQLTDTNYKRMLVRALTPENTDAVRIGVAGHNLFDLAFAWLLAERRGVVSKVEFEMLLGMATAQADAVRATTGGLLLYTPVVHPGEFDAAISYLVRRLEENASTDNFMSGVFELDEPAIFARERDRFSASLDGLDLELPKANRTQDRLHAGVPAAASAFHNEADTDPALAPNREWGRAILARSVDTQLGLATVAAAAVPDEEALVALIETAHATGSRWGAVSGTERAETLHRVGEVLSVFRGRFIEVMAAETGKTIAEADVEVSEAIDFAHYYAERAHELDRVDGATFVPTPLTLVTPPWNFPVAIPAGGVLSALAAGSAVLFKPAGQARRCGAVLAEAIWEAGVPRDLLTLLDVSEAKLGRQLVTAPQVGRVILTGSFETASLFRSWKSDLPLLAETSGKNAIIVTPSADLDLAVSDIVKSAFGNAGQKCSAASLAILVGSVGESERFRRQLKDAVASLRVGYPSDPATQMGPVVEGVTGKLARALTELGEGESWLVKPRQLDGTDRLWSPGVRDGVAPGSEFHLTEYFGPVLGIMTAETLDEAMALQNAVDYGLTAGIHSLDTAEVARWLDTVQAGNLYINRHITGAVVRRQPFGGWKRSSVGPGTKAGGPNTLFALGSWRPVSVPSSGDLGLEALDARVAALIEACQPALDYDAFDRVRAGALSDAAAWDAEFGVARDVSALGVERNVFRYRPARVTVRLAAGGDVASLVRVLAAGVRARAEVRVSSAVPLPSGMLALVAKPNLLQDAVLPIRSITIESDDAWLTRVAAEKPERIRLIGPDSSVEPASVESPLVELVEAPFTGVEPPQTPHAQLATAVGGAPDVAIYAGPVTGAGRVEMLPFLREQAVSLTAHRFGNPDPAMESLPI